MRPQNKLAAKKVDGFHGPGRISDGGGLYLQAANGGKSWVFQFQRHGATRYMGLGSYPDVSLALARELRAQCREQLARNIDPIESRKAAGLAAKEQRAKLCTFKQCTEDFIAANESKWRYAKHARDWRTSLERYAYPIFGGLAVSAVDSGLVVKALTPLVTDRPVLASRLRGRIETVLDFATAAGRRGGPNPADKTTLSHMLPLRSEKAGVQHQPALPFAKLPQFMAVLRATPGTAARQLELTILTGMRHGAVRGARCGEFDPAAAVWTVPAARMKSLGRDHRVPMVGRALDIVRELLVDDPAAPLFRNGRGLIGKHASSKLMPRLLAAIGHDQPAVQHGFRSALRDWTSEVTSFSSEVVEQVLGHRIKSSVERAYRRGELLDKRRVLMLAWDSYCTGCSADVVALRA